MKQRFSWHLLDSEAQILYGGRAKFRKVVNIFMVWVCFWIKRANLPIGLQEKIPWWSGNIWDDKYQNVQSFTEEFRKQELTLNIPLDSLETLMKYIGTSHNYLHHSLLLFDPTNLYEASVKAIHLENRGKHQQDDHAKNTMRTKKKEGRPSCAHWKKEGHDEEHCWKVHTKLKSKRSGRKWK